MLAFARRNAGVHLHGVQAGALEAVEEVLVLLAGQVSGGSQHHRVPARVHGPLDGHAQADLGLARAGGGLDQQALDAVAQARGDLVDGILLVAGQREDVAGLDQFALLGHALNVLLDPLPDLVVIHEFSRWFRALDGTGPPRVPSAVRPLRALRGEPSGRAVGPALGVLGSLE